MSKLITFIFCFNLLQGEGAEDISFRYGFMGQLQSNPDSIIELGDKSLVHTGDAVKINIGYVNDSYFYLIYLDSDGNYFLNLPEDSRDDNKQDTLYATILQGGLTNPPGNETFYLLNSNEPMSELTKLLSRYESAPNKAKIKPKIDNINPRINDNLKGTTEKPVNILDQTCKSFLIVYPDFP